MPSISKIRFTNVVYENGAKRYNDDIFQFDGYNGAILLENGGGKTVFVQTALQAVLPHHNLEERKIRETLSLEGSPCHIAIEWILHEKPRRYLVTAVTLFLTNNKLDSYRYTYEYDSDDNHSIDEIPFVTKNQEGSKRPASKGEIADYYQGMQSRNMNAKLFKTIKEYHEYIEENYQIIPSEWRSIARINSAEGGVENYFENCKTTGQLVDNLLIPVVEEAISENGTKDFVNAFEEQRERFKKHKQLRERIKESQLIEDKIGDYVKVFQNYHDIENKYLNEKRYAKALYLYMNEEKEKLIEQLSKNKGDAEEIEKLVNELKKKEASYEMALLNKELETYEEELKAAEVLFYEVKQNLDEKSAKYQSLKVAKLKQDIKEIEESIKNNEEQLKRLEENLDLDEIKEQIEENSSKLRGYFLKEEEEINKEIEKIKIQRNKVHEDWELENKKLTELESTKEKLMIEYNQKKGQITEIEKDLKRIKENISSLDPNEDIKEQQQKWMKRINYLEEETAAHKTKINELKSERLSLEENLEKDRDDLGYFQNKVVLLRENIVAITKEHDELFIELKMINDSWGHYDSIYKKERTIISHLESKIDILNKEKEILLLEERTTGRYKDDYGNHDIFTVEPLIEKWIASWKTQFTAIETGTQYVQRAAKELKQREDAFLKNYPYWSLAIIVEDREIDKLKEKIERNRNQITYPVLILGQQEARNIIKHGNFIREMMIFPKHWGENVNQEIFEKWKTEINQKSQELTQRRKEKEEEMGKYTQALKEVNAFLSKYPYENFKELEKELEEVEGKTKSSMVQINQKVERLTEIQGDSDRYNQKISDYKDEMNQLVQWIQAISLYIAKERERQNSISLTSKMKEEIEKHKFKIHTVNKEISMIKERLDSLEEEKRTFTDKLNTLKRDALYDEVKNATPKYTSWSKVGLQEERNHLKLLLDNKLGNIRDLYEYIEKDKIRKKACIKDLERARKESNMPIDETMDYNLYGEEQLEQLLETINHLKPIKKDQEDNLEKKRNQFRDQLTKVNLRKEQFLKVFDEIIDFEDSLDLVKINLAKEKEALDERKEKNKILYERLSKEEKEIDEGIRSLEIKNGKYEYLIEGMKPSPLEQDFYTEFPYRRLTFIEEMMKALEELKEMRDGSYLRLEEDKNRLIKFCDEGIKDPRLRERTVSGVKQKDKYEEVIQWQNRMKKSIQHTIRVAEDDMRDHDKDLEQFVNHLFIYLRTITEELSMIPKKTRIKVEDKWKEIYVFNIPSLSEEEGKEEIRKYIDWMLQELENYQFRNEDGTENSASIRKEIEKWLDVKQLLPIVLKNNPIKVSCRKVTNDNKISSSLTTWESSNKWSGGEKWSKNMTLFLGILNYVAEKRQGIMTGLKTNRTVIVDNPFGKASSDHVLDPVFYIAEKLGFQIIALTAHTEGSFIRTYFPVVYSCRLREAVNNRSMIIDKEKEIQYAFFRDKDPNSLNRLQEKEQMSLFGI